MRDVKAEMLHYATVMMRIRKTMRYRKDCSDVTENMPIVVECNISCK
jgi:hypothetical protein